jgi:hypothetical protein
VEELSGTGLALAGIRYAVRELQTAELTTGRALTDFSALVTRCSQLRNMARRDYKARTGRRCGRRWQYEPWMVPHEDAGVLELMHELRSEDFHQAPFQVGLQEAAIFEPFPGMRLQAGQIGFGKGAFQAAVPEAAFGDSAAGVRMSVPGPDGEPVDVPLIEREIRWVILPGTERAKALMDMIHEDSILELARRAQAASEAYMDWFDREVPPLT